MKRSAWDAGAPKAKRSMMLQRLDAAIADAYENDRFADEINRPQPSPAQPRKRRR
jgi:hypothetical protein